MDETIRRAIELCHAGAFAEAEPLLRLVVEALPDHAVAGHDLALVELALGRTADGLARLRSVLEANPGEALFWISYVGAVLDHAGDPLAADGLLTQAIGHGLAGTEADLLRQRVADGLLRRGIELHLGWEAMAGDGGGDRVGLLDSAAECYGRVLAHQPSNLRAAINLAQALAMRGRQDAAAGLLEQVLALAPDLAEAHFNLAAIRKVQGRADEAAAHYRRVLELHPDDYKALSNLGGVLTGQRLDAEALECYRRVAALAPDDPVVQLNLGSALGRQGEAEDAVAAFHRALAAIPEDDDLRAATRDDAAIGLSATLQELGRIDEARSAFLGVHARRHRRRNAADQVAGMESVTALIPIGRSGSLFVQSLIDGHPEMSTLPGVYLKGWFGRDVWPIFQPSPANPDWRRDLVESLLDEFAPMFDARSRKNVIGRPFDNTGWLARDMGFVEMGPDRATPFQVDRAAFAEAMLGMLAPLPTVTAKDCFKLMHAAYDAAVGYGGPKPALFYHIHNPGTDELAGFLSAFPAARLLYVTRQPVPALESWLMFDLIPPDSPADNRIRAQSWGEMVNTILTVFRNMHPHFVPGVTEAGIRLEDIKSDPAGTLSRLAAWMGVADHPCLRESGFGGLKYWGTLSASGPVDGFSTKNLQQSKGRVFGPRDIVVLETLFWPFARRYGYTSWSEAEFRARLAEIRPWLDQPLDFERVHHDGMRPPRPPIETMPAYRRFHAFLHGYWTLLDRQGDYHGIPAPLP